jgi:hypothetical protein
VLVTTGLLRSVWLIPGPRQAGPATLDSQTGRARF